MSQLQNIQKRTKGIKITKKITKAMEMISIAVLKQLKRKFIQTQPYFYQLHSVLNSIIYQNKENISNFIDKYDIYRALIFNTKSIKKNNINIEKDKFIKEDKRLLILITSDKGLCAGFNTSLIKETKKIIKDSDLKTVLLCIGKKGYEAFAKSVEKDFVNIIEFNKNFDFRQLSNSYLHANLAMPIILKILGEQFNEVKIIYTHFYSVVQQTVQSINLIPYDLNNDLLSKNTYFFKSNPLESQQYENRKIDINYSYEDKKSLLLAQVIFKALKAAIYQAFLHSRVSEETIRMIAMDNASRNCKDLLENLNHEANKLRQSVVTKELIEVISGMSNT